MSELKLNMNVLFQGLIATAITGCFVLLWNTLSTLNDAVKELDTTVKLVNSAVTVLDEHLEQTNAAVSALQAEVTRWHDEITALNWRVKALEQPPKGASH